LVEYGHKVIYAALDVRSLRIWGKWDYKGLYNTCCKVEPISILVREHP